MTFVHVMSVGNVPHSCESALCEKAKVARCKVHPKFLCHNVWLIAQMAQCSAFQISMCSCQVSQQTKLFFSCIPSLGHACALETKLALCNGSLMSVMPKRLHQDIHLSCLCIILFCQISLRALSDDINRRF